MSWSTWAISESRKSTWRRPASTVSRSQTANCCSASQAPALDAEEARGGRTVLQAAHQDGVDLVLDARARPDQLSPARQSPAHRPDTLVRRPDAVELARPQQLGQRSRVQAVGLRARLTDAGVARRDDDHSRNMRLEDRGDRPRVAGHLQRHPVARVQALDEQLQRLGPRLDPARRPQLALGEDRHLAEVAMDIQRYRSHSTPPRRRRLGENRWANDIDGSALAAQPGKSQGRPLKSPGSKPIAQSGLPSLRSPEGPCPSQPNLSPAPDDTGAFTEQFHAAKSGARPPLRWRAPLTLVTAARESCLDPRGRHAVAGFGAVGALLRAATGGRSAARASSGERA